jgi:hypothetical protein
MYCTVQVNKGERRSLRRSESNLTPGFQARLTFFICNSRLGLQGPPRNQISRPPKIGYEIITLGLRVLDIITVLQYLSPTASQRRMSRFGGVVDTCPIRK